MSRTLPTALTALLGCRHPVVQSAMGWVADARLVSATCAAGGFGFLAGATLRTDQLERAIQQVQESTQQPFGVNFHMFQPNAREVIERVIAYRVRAVSYGRGPDAKVIRRLKDAGVLCIPTVGAAAHARKAVTLGADAVTVQGSEGGGHTGRVSTLVLLPQVLDAVRVPVIASGGFHDGRGLAAALAFGAAGVSMGTRFLMTCESPVPFTTLARYLDIDDPSAIDTTTAIDGLPQRVIPTPWLKRLESAGFCARWWLALRSALSWRRHAGESSLRLLRTAWRASRAPGSSLQQALLAANAPVAIQRAMVQGRPDEGVLPAGQVAALIGELRRCAELIEEMVDEAIDCLQRPLQPFNQLARVR
jgi:nitronate monooxygenase